MAAATAPVSPAAIASRRRHSADARALTWGSARSSGASSPAHAAQTSIRAAASRLCESSRARSRYQRFSAVYCLPRTPRPRRSTARISLNRLRARWIPVRSLAVTSPSAAAAASRRSRTRRGNAGPIASRRLKRYAIHGLSPCDLTAPPALPSSQDAADSDRCRSGTMRRQVLTVRCTPSCRRKSDNPPAASGPSGRCRCRCRAGSVVEAHSRRSGCGPGCPPRTGG